MPCPRPAALLNIFNQLERIALGIRWDWVMYDKDFPSEMIPSKRGSWMTPSREDRFKVIFYSLPKSLSGIIEDYNKGKIDENLMESYIEDLRWVLPIIKQYLNLAEPKDKIAYDLLVEMRRLIIDAMGIDIKEVLDVSQ